MQHTYHKKAPIIFVAALLLLTCAGPGTPPSNLRVGADLVPVPKIFSFDPVSISLCNRDAGGKLIVPVRNQGTSRARGTSTRVVFFGLGARFETTDSIPAGGTVNVLFQMPAGCFNPDCDFRVTVDSDAQIDELSEENNSASDRCIG
ncbi:hypothetical protein D3OALGA1CA_1672 [Olavius algarvensis associated proteobacterium Delta 3]|nr:hypothetical protein D3OALGA1CA_1672 [Olavius algarvensis associated proteobacterium Delta 3]